MTDNERHFDEESDLKVTSEFAEDLEALFRSDLTIPAEVDRSVIDRAHRRFVRRPGLRKFVLRLSGVAAAAAVIIFVFTFNLRETSVPVISSLDTAVQQDDFDRNGQVNILDAFKLARYIESAKHPESKWDINGDGLVNRGDVDSIALAAVRLNKGV